MWKQIAIVIFSLYISSCITRRRCLEKFPPIIEIKDSIIVKEKTVYVPVKVDLPADSTTMVEKFGYVSSDRITTPVDTILIPKEGFRKITKSESGKVSAEVIIVRDSVRVNCKTDSLTEIIDSLEVKLKVEERHRFVSKTTEVEVVKRVIPWWVWVSYAAIGIYIFRKPLSKMILYGKLPTS